MSRVLSSNAIKAMYSSETEETLITLVTIYDPAGGTTPLLRLCDTFTQEITSLTTDAEKVYGVIGPGGAEYLFLPMEILLPSEAQDGTSGCSIRFNFVTPEAIEIIRSDLTEPTKILLEIVLSSTPSVVEASFPGFYITSASYNADSIQIQLGMINYNTEPFPAYGFTPRYFPGLF
jgi:hypothetical protein